MKTVIGLRKTKYRGIERVGWAFTLAAAAYNLIRAAEAVGGRMSAQGNTQIAAFNIGISEPAELRPLSAPRKCRSSSTACYWPWISR